MLIVVVFPVAADRCCFPVAAVRGTGHQFVLAEQKLYCCELKLIKMLFTSVRLLFSLTIVCDAI